MQSPCWKGCRFLRHHFGFDTTFGALPRFHWRTPRCHFNTFKAQVFRVRKGITFGREKPLAAPPCRPRKPPKLLQHGALKVLGFGKIAPQETIFSAPAQYLLRWGVYAAPKSPFFWLKLPAEALTQAYVEDCGRAMFPPFFVPRFSFRNLVVKNFPQKNTHPNTNQMFTRNCQVTRNFKRSFLVRVRFKLTRLLQVLQGEGTLTAPLQN